MAVWCVNLKERFGEKYRITFDPAYNPKRKRRKKLDPWMMLIPCKFGEIGPQGGTRLRWDCEGHKNKRGEVKRLPYVELYTEGDDDMCVLFDVAYFEAFAKVVKPKRRFQPSETQLENLKRGAPHRYKPAERPEQGAQGPVDERLGSNMTSERPFEDLRASFGPRATLRRRKTGPGNRSGGRGSNLSKSERYAHGAVRRSHERTSYE